MIEKTNHIQAVENGTKTKEERTIDSCQSHRQDHRDTIGDVIAQKARRLQSREGFLLAGLSVGCFLNRSIGSDEIRRHPSQGWDVKSTDLVLLSVEIPDHGLKTHQLYN